jgi:hypothetical protein
MLTGDAEGKLHVRCQVEDYALRGFEFETMGFLSFTVNTYEQRFGKKKKQVEDEDEIQLTHSQNSSVRYLSSHPRTETCY